MCKEQELNEVEFEELEEVVQEVEQERKEEEIQCGEEEDAPTPLEKELEALEREERGAYAVDGVKPDEEQPEEELGTDEEAREDARRRRANIPLTLSPLNVTDGVTLKRAEKRLKEIYKLVEPTTMDLSHGRKLTKATLPDIQKVYDRFQQRLKTLLPAGEDISLRDLYAYDRYEYVIKRRQLCEVAKTYQKKNSLDRMNTKCYWHISYEIVDKTTNSCEITITVTRRVEDALKNHDGLDNGEVRLTEYGVSETGGVCTYREAREHIHNTVGGLVKLHEENLEVPGYTIYDIVSNDNKQEVDRVKRVEPTEIVTEMFQQLN